MLTYTNRYQARKHATSADVVVKVWGDRGEYAYTVMDAREYQIWRRQK